MKLDLESGVTIGSPKEDDLSRIEGEEFAILSRDADPYIQCAKTSFLRGKKKYGAPLEYALEYQDGSIRNHFQATDNPITLKRALVALKKYLNNDDSWIGEFQWKQMELDNDASKGQPALPSDLPNSEFPLELFKEDGQYEFIAGVSVSTDSELCWSHTIDLPSLDSTALTQEELTSKWNAAMDAICKRVANHIGKETDVRFAAYVNDPDGIPIDSLDAIAIPGLAVIVAVADSDWGGEQSSSFKSELLENATWLDVCIVLHEQIKRTLDRHHVYIEGVHAIGKTTTIRGVDVPLYEIGLGS